MKKLYFVLVLAVLLDSLLPTSSTVVAPGNMVIPVIITGINPDIPGPVPGGLKDDKGILFSRAFSKKMIKEISQRHLEEFSDRMLVILLEEMKKLGYDFSKKFFPKPKIIIGDKMTRQDFDKAAGKNLDIYYPHKHLLAAYIDETNTIILPGQAYLDTLFHEMVHFVQVQYRQDFDYYAVMEPEAVEFQEWFKKAYMNQEEDGLTPYV